jgi:hypothetical protein
MSLVKEFAERGWIRTVSAKHGIYECQCAKCARKQPIIEPTGGIGGGPDLETLVEECGWSFPVENGQKICLCPKCGGYAPN